MLLFPYSGSIQQLQVGERVASRMSSLLVTELACLLSCGWEPSEVERVLRYKADSSAVRVITGCLIEALRNCSLDDQIAWEDQLVSFRDVAYKFDSSLTSWCNDLGAVFQRLLF